MQIEITGQMVAAGFTGIALLGSALGWMHYNGKKTIRRLQGEEKIELSGKAKEEFELRTSLLERYRELYNLEKEKSGAEIKALRDEIVELKSEMEYLRHRQEELQSENERVRALNLRQQEDARKSQHEINNLKQELLDLRDEHT